MIKSENLSITLISGALLMTLAAFLLLHVWYMVAVPCFMISVYWGVRYCLAETASRYIRYQALWGAAGVLLMFVITLVVLRQ